jgi:hypothetical protein
MMKHLLLALALALLAGPAAAVEKEGRTYLLSLGEIQLAEGERIERFTIETWGVDVLAVCRIPPGWRIEAGRSAALDGHIAGIAGHGVAFLSDTAQFEGLALVRLWGARQEQARKLEGGRVPATFAGSVRIADRGERQLSQQMLRLALASACPPPVLAED